MSYCIGNKSQLSCLFLLVIIFLVPLSIYASDNTSSEIDSVQYKDSLGTESVLQVGCEYSYPPFCIIDENGQADGFSVELLKEAAHVAGLKLNFRVDYWDTLKADLKEGRLDILPLVGKTQERTNYYDFTFPYTTNYGAIFVRKGDTRINSLVDLKDKEVVVMKGDTAEEFVRRENISSRILSVDTYEIALKKLSQGHYDAVIMQQLMGTNLLNELGIDNMSPVGELLMDFRQDFCFAVRKGDKKLQSILNESLRQVIDNGVYDNLYHKWFAEIQVNERDFVLTQKEKEWIEEHPVIRLGFNPYMEPLLIKRDDGSLSGIYPEIINEINKRLGLNIEIVLDDWDVIVNKARNREIDGLMANAPSQAKASNLTMVRQIQSSYPIVYARHGSGIKFDSMDDMVGKKVAYQKEVRMLEIRLDEYEGKCQRVPVDSTLEAIKLLLEEKVDVVLAINFQNYQIAKHSLSGLKIIYYDIEHEAVTSMGIRQEWPELVSIINKGIDLIGPMRINGLVANWTNINDGGFGIGLTEKERKWLSEHPIIRSSITNTVKPMSFQDSSGVNRGIIVDYIKLIGKKIGVDIELEVVGFDQRNDTLKEGAVDLMPSYKGMASEDEFLDSDVFLNLQYVIVTRNDASFIRDINWLRGKKVAIYANSTSKRFIQAYTDIDIAEYNSTREGLQAVSKGDCDAYLGVSVVTSYVIMNDKILNLKIAAQAGISDVELCFKVRDEFSEFIPILNKALNAITENESRAILNKWMSVRYEQVQDWTKIWQWIGVVVSVPICCLLLVLFWNYQLGRVVKAKTEELQQAKKFTEDAINSLEDTFMVFDPIARRPILWNKSMNIVTGYEDQEIAENPLPYTYFSEEDSKLAVEAIREAIKDGSSSCELEIIRRDGELVPSDFVLTRVDDKSGIMNCMVVVGRDISDRRVTEKELEDHRNHLEKIVSKRTKQLKARNQELEDALSQLQNTQAQLVLFEKLGALKHLVSGIAHELNSPLGAINNSREILWNNIKKLSENVLLLAKWIESTNGDIVACMLNDCFDGKNDVASVSPREKRQARAKMAKLLEDNNIKDADAISQKLVGLHIYDNIEHMIPVLKEEGILENLDVIGSVVESVIACDTIKLAVNKASKIVNALNSYIRKGGNSSENDSLEPVDLKESLDNVLTLFYNAIKYNVTLEFDCPDDLPVVMGDSDGINQVWTNLIKNSIDAMNGAGELKIKAIEKDGGVAVSIKDNGIGMTKDVLTRVFEPLFTTKPAGEGTGLGMDIVHKIVVENHGGKIDIDSEPGVGTTINVWLPVGQLANA